MSGIFRWLRAFHRALWLTVDCQALELRKANLEKRVALCEEILRIKSEQVKS